MNLSQLKQLIQNNLRYGEQKRCSKCGEQKYRSQFYNNKKSADGLYSYCKSCKDSAREDYRLKNLEKEKVRSKEYNKKWYQENKAKKNLQSKAWRIQNPEKFREYVKRSRALHIVEIKKRVKQYCVENKELIAARYKAWSLANPERERMRAKNRRARIKGSVGITTTEEWEDLKVFHKHTCLCCGQREPEIKLTRDHIKPLIMGGDNTIKNSQPLCKSCNSKKGTKEIDYR